ncbi:hypothetical protein CLAIMM_14860 [Cladophialophora immunda]|nr:hypothetical protein CLAIMM_14860 [Cladophialophora immunda]
MGRWGLFTRKKGLSSSRTDLASAYVPSNHDLPDHASIYHRKGTTHNFAEVPLPSFGSISTLATPQANPDNTLSRSSSSDGHLCSEVDPCYTSQRPSATTHLANPGSSTCPTPIRASSPGSASRESSTTANYSSPITDLSNERLSDGEDLSLLELVQKITEYHPCTDATEIWMTSKRTILQPTAFEIHDAESRQWCTSLEFWQSMGNVADALAAAGHFSSAFDLHYICLVEILGSAMSHARQISLPDDLVHPETEQDALTQNLFHVVANKGPVLQLLVKAAIGIARSCSGLDHAKLACSALDAVLRITGEIESLGTFRFLATLFDCYEYEMGEAGWGCRGARPFERITTLELEPWHSAESNPYSWKTEWRKVIHPTIQHREYLTFFSRMSCYTQPSWRHVTPLPSVFGLPTPSADLVTVLHSTCYPYICNPDPVVQDNPLRSFPPEYTSGFTAFLDQCHTMIIADLATLDSYTKVESLTDQGLEDATFTLFWFLVCRKGLLELDSKQPECATDFRPAPFPQTAYHSANLDACFILCRLLSSLFARESGPPNSFLIGPNSLSSFAAEAMYQIRQSPHEFLNRYLRQVLNLRPLVDSSSLSPQPATEHKHVQSTILAPPFDAWKFKAPPTRHEPNQPGDDMNVPPLTFRASLNRQNGTLVATSRFESTAPDRKTKSTHPDSTGINNGSLVKSPMRMPPPPRPAPSVITTSSGLSEDTKAFRKLARRVNDPGALGCHAPDDKSDQHGFEPSWDCEDFTDILAGITGPSIAFPRLHPIDDHGLGRL